MTTGAKHKRLTEISVAVVGDEERHYFRDCRCTIGEDHKDAEVLISQFDPNDDEDGEEGEELSASEAADIWRSKGMDEDYMFGYSEEELRREEDED